MSSHDKRPKTWAASDKSIRAVQVIFELGQAHSKALRIKAIQNDLSYSDQIREILNLPRKKPIRPRLSVSLSEEDYQLLAKRYKLKLTEKDQIREKMKQELVTASKTTKTQDP